MFEMFATIVAACAAAIYGLSRSVFMSGVHRNLYRAAFIITSSLRISKNWMSILMIIFTMISTPPHFTGQDILSVISYRIFSLTIHTWRETTTSVKVLTFTMVE